MSLLTIEHSGMMLDKDPPSLVTALNSIPLVGQKGLVHVKRTWHFCQTGIVGVEPTHIWVKAIRVPVSPNP